MDGQRFANDFSDTHARIERSKRILEDHLHLAPLCTQFRSRQRKQIASRKNDMSAVRLYQSQKHARQSGLAAAAFAHYCKRFALGNLEADVIHSNKLLLLRGAFERASAAAITFRQVSHT